MGLNHLVGSGIGQTEATYDEEDEDEDDRDGKEDNDDDNGDDGYSE